MISNNLSELDQLLNDLNSAQFMAEVDKKSSQPGRHCFQASVQYCTVNSVYNEPTYKALLVLHLYQGTSSLYVYKELSL